MKDLNMKVKTKCRMKWCYSPLRHEDGTCDKFCFYNTKEINMKRYVDLDEILLALPKSAAKIIEDWPLADVIERRFTNADKIRRMTNEQLAAWLTNIVECGDDCPAIEECVKKEEMGLCYPCLLEWLGRDVSK